MKLSQSVLAFSTAISTVGAFTPVMNRQCRPTPFSTTSFHMTAVPEGEVIVESAMPVADPYERIGIAKDELALGIDATEFLQWIGSKQELVDKFQRDNKGMEEERANSEVSKFMMDPEMVNAYIKFERDKIENPPDLKAEAEQTLSDPRTIATYAAWLIGGASFGYIRKEIIEPKYASGEWEEIHINLPSPPAFMIKHDEVADAVQSIASALHSMDAPATMDSAHSSLDNILSTIV